MTLDFRFSEEQDGWSVPLTSEFTFIVGLEELPGLSDLLLFPNPTSGELILRLTSSNAEQLRLTVLDATGRVVRAVTAGQAESWIEEGIIFGGMIPKVRAAVEAVRGGVAQAVITNLAGVQDGTGTGIIGAH